MNNARRILGLAGAMVIIVAGMWLRGNGIFQPSGGPQTPPTPRPAPTASTPTVTAPTRHAGGGAGFRSQELLDEHYQKHGGEFGAVSKEQYLHMAQDLRDQPAGGDVLELARTDGVTTKFNRINRAFIAYNRDGTIRTFFRPNDGEAYFRRQADSEH